MSTYTDIVDPNGGGAYSSLNSWEANAETDNSSIAGDTLIADCRRNGASVDSTSVIVAGNLATMQIVANSSYLHNGIPGDGYVLAADPGSNTGEVLRIEDASALVDHIEVKNTRAGSANSTAGTSISTSHVWRDVLFASATGRGFEGDPGTSTVSLWPTLENCVAYSCGDIGFTAADSTRTRYVAYNCTAINCVGIGFDTGGTNAAIAVNCVAYGNTGEDFYTGDTWNATADYNASEDTTASTNFTNSVTGIGSADFADVANDDPHLASGSSCIDAGVGPSTDSDVPTADIDGDTRSGTTCDIGADEYVAAGGGTTYEGAAADGLSMGEPNLNGLGTLIASAAEGISLGEPVISGVGSLVASSADGISLGEPSVTGMGILGAIAVDGMSMGEVAPSGIGTFNIVVTDGSVFAEVVEGLTGIFGSAADGVSFAEVVSGLVSKDGTASDGIVLSETIAAALTRLGTVVDGISLGDSDSVIGTYNLTVTDGVSFSEVVNAIADIAIILTDGVSLGELVSGDLDTISGGVRFVFRVGDRELTWIVPAAGVDFILSAVDRKITN